MFKLPFSIYIFILGIFTTFFTSCGFNQKKPGLFKALEASETGLDFNNKLEPTQSFNIFQYMYFYNGSGIGVGDFNKDGLIDVFFDSNQGDNKLYLNRGNFKFEDITQKAGIPELGSWGTGVSVVDINNDGLLDIYISCVGILNHGNFRNQLLVCTGLDKDGIPHFKDEAKEYGLDYQGYSTQALFFDYDGDGDLDMFLLNHTVRQIGIVGPRSILNKEFNPLTGDRIFRNDHGHYTDVTASTGIYSSVLSFGLGVCASDIDLDGYPDLYIGNDFHENDYLYINQKNGTFKDEVPERMMHTSQFSMGVDIADINNDAYPEIISMDMMPFDNYILKRSEGEDDYDSFFDKVKNYGYNYQYTRNNLQYNRKNGMFSEVGTYSGVFATDWSWSCLWLDFDNDGWKDLFISNGIPKRMNDIDFIHFVSDEAIQSKIQSKNLDAKDLDLINKFPEIKIPNKFFVNKKDLRFDDQEENIENNLPTYSNGAVYADFNQDGKMDILVNNINQSAILYRNVYKNPNHPNKVNNYVDIKLKGSKQNINAIGAKMILFCGKEIRTYEKFPVHGFMSSMEIPMHIGLENTQVDSSVLIWPDNTYQKITLNNKSHILNLAYQSNLPKYNYTIIRNFNNSHTTYPVKDITKETEINFVHKENSFNEFDREQLIPHMNSTEGPALTIADVNGDGLEDIFIGSSKRNKSALYIQKPNGKFYLGSQPALMQDSVYEDIGASFVDVNKDGKPDLVIASGGNEFYGPDEHLEPRIYLNDGHGQFSRLKNAFQGIYINASVVISYDINRDNNPDLFIGGRTVPFEYGKIPQSYIFLNDGQGHFKDVTQIIAPELSHIGLVTSAIWFDLDKNGEKDLIITLEWGGIYAFMNHHGHFTKKVLTNKKGWWNFILPIDLDHNGNTDFIIGNLGLNNRLKEASFEKPIRLYCNDFDNNGKMEQILTYYLNGKEIPFSNLEELTRQLPILKIHYLFAGDFAKANLKDIFNSEKLDKSEILTANYFSSAVLMNDGKLNFTIKALPWQAQLSPLRTAIPIDANGDDLTDILVFGNYYENNIQMGRYDADYGTILINLGKGNFRTENLNGLTIKGQVRHVDSILIGNRKAIILAKNNDSLKIIEFRK